eukprot:11094005-Ditylum_brightwellii.AAC.1
MDDILSHSQGGANATLSTTSSKASASTKPSPADFLTFSGEIEDQDNYKTKVEAQIGQTVFKFLLSQDAVNQDEKERDEELFNKFKNSFHR